MSVNSVRAVTALAVLLTVATGTAHASDSIDTPDDTATVVDAPADDSVPDVAPVQDESVVQQPVGYMARVRVTYYNLIGRTFSGIPLYMGSTACSWNFRIGTKFRFPSGETVTCIDRGLLGASGWLDVWKNPGLAHRYEPYTTVMVIP